MILTIIPNGVYFLVARLIGSFRPKVLGHINCIRYTFGEGEWCACGASLPHKMGLSIYLICCAKCRLIKSTVRTDDIIVLADAAAGAAWAFNTIVRLIFAVKHQHFATSWITNVCECQKVIQTYFSINNFHKMCLNTLQWPNDYNWKRYLFNFVWNFATHWMNSVNEYKFIASQ